MSDLSELVTLAKAVISKLKGTPPNGCAAFCDDAAVCCTAVAGELTVLGNSAGAGDLAATAAVLHALAIAIRALPPVESLSDAPAGD